MPLTSKKKAFADAVLRGKTNKEAAIAAGYSAATASPAGSRLVKDQDVISYISRARAFVAQAVEDRVSLEPPLADGKSPLEYMLSVMRDPDADEIRRDKMAVAAAPFVHGKIGEGGKKDEKQRAAKNAGGGKFAQAAPPKLVVNNR